MLRFRLARHNGFTGAHALAGAILLNDEKTALEKEIKLKRETAEKDLIEREKVIAERERELNELRARASAFPKELETAVALAVKETSERLKFEAKSREDLALKQFEGERNVLTARNESLERANKDVLTANAKLAQQLVAAYQKVQDIAEKSALNRRLEWMRLCKMLRRRGFGRIEGVPAAVRRDSPKALPPRRLRKIAMSNCRFEVYIGLRMPVPWLPNFISQSTAGTKGNPQMTQMDADDERGHPQISSSNDYIRAAVRTWI